MSTVVIGQRILQHPESPVAETEHLRALERQEISRVAEVSRLTTLTWTTTLIRELAAQVDYSPFIPYVREQGGYSCGMQAAAACWDIMNERATPYSPNLSVNRMIWLWKWIDIDHKPVIGHDGKTYTSCADYQMALGVPSESSELTNTDAVQWPTEDGNFECANFRLAAPNSTPLAIDAAELRMALNKGPVRVVVFNNSHFVALVGYDDAAQRFKFVNSWGDQWGEAGFGYINYAAVKQEIQGAEQFTVLPPKSLPAARISFTHSCRQDVYLWLGIEGRPSAKRIWPTGQLQDASRSLTYTVTLPRGFSWPPAPGNRLYLDVYDCGGRYESGGQLTAFSAAFCGQVIPSAQVANAPVNFGPHTLKRIYLP